MTKNINIIKRIEEMLRVARKAEQDGDQATAIKLYEQSIKEGYLNEYAFERLMILYREQKNDKEELRVLNQAISMFAHELEKHLKKSFSKNVDGNKVEDLSNDIMSKRSPFTYYAEPLDKWMKRKELLVNRQ